MKTIAELGEDGLIAKLCGGLSSSDRVLVGPGDDCAVVEVGDELILMKTDAVVEGVHYLPGGKTSGIREIGGIWKSSHLVHSSGRYRGGDFSKSHRFPKFRRFSRRTEFPPNRKSR